MAKIITVYINGTDEPNDDFAPNAFGMRPVNFITSLANILHQLTVQDTNNISFCLAGCGIRNPYMRDLGGIFTWHLESQIDEMVKEIKMHLGKEKTILNLYGFSRGGAGVFLLAKKLKDIDPEQLETNILAFEPVPGNFIYNVYLDKLLGLNLTLSSLISDLTDCKNLKSVQSFYTNEPLPDIACHAPILPALPATCAHTADVLPGCHKNAELFNVRYDQATRKYNITPYNAQSGLAFHHIVEFLSRCGTKYDFSKFNLDARLVEPDFAPLLFKEYKDNTPLEDKSRAMHFSNGIKTQVGKHQQLYFNINDNNPEPTYGNGQKSAAWLVYPALIFSALVYHVVNKTKAPRLKI